MERDKVRDNYILITSMNFPSGGAGATYLNLFCRGLKANGCSVDVILVKGHAFGNYKYNGPRKNITAEGVPYRYIGFKQRPDKAIPKMFEELISICNLCRYLFSLINKSGSYKFLIFNSEMQYNIPVLIYSRIFRIKVDKFVAEIIDKSEFSNSLFGRLKRLGYNYNYKHLNLKSDKLLVFSLYLKNFYVGLGYDENKIMVQPNLTDFEYWKTDNNEVRYTLGYSGAPYLKDGLLDLFRAISLLNDENLDISLQVIGDATFGKSLIPSLKEECANLGIADKTFFTGLVELPKVKQHLSECNILAITRPSTLQTKAGFPTKLGEYFATRRPVLATNFGDMEEYFTDGTDIVMAECGNPEAIAQKIKWMIENNRELEVIAGKGYERARELLEYKSSVKRMISFLESN
jgi:glycosyltransferase involved in cell wall biosynthesis